MMKLLVLNFGIVKEVSWQWDLFVELTRQYDCKVDIISAATMWQGRGGRTYPRYEEEEGVRIFRIYDSIPQFRSEFNARYEDVQAVTDSRYDLCICFHQVNFDAALKIKRDFGVPLVLVVEQSHVVSGIQNGRITPRWFTFMKECRQILSWSPSDVRFEEKIKCKKMPVGCFKGIEKLPLAYHKKVDDPVMVYQGSIIGDGWKSCQPFIEHVSAVLDQTPITRFEITGMFLDDAAKRVVRTLQEMYGDRVQHTGWLPRPQLLEKLSKAFIGYMPVTRGTLVTFVMEAWGCGVPMLMPLAEFSPIVRWLKSPAKVNSLFDKDRYWRFQADGIKYYRENHSLDSSVKEYYEVFRKVVEG